MFQGIKDWFERRAAFRELRADDENTGRGFTRYFGEEIATARAALSDGDAAQALRIWNKLYALYPDLAMTSKPGLTLLLDLGRFDEAESLTQTGLKRFPGASNVWGGSAQVAYRRGDLQEALRRSEVARRKFSHMAEGYTIATACFTDLGRFDEADVMIGRAARKLPHNFDVLEAYARYAVRRKDWSAAVQRWGLMNKRFKHFLGPVGMAHALRELGRFDEADRIANEACARFARNNWVLAELARTAAARGDLDSALNHWEIIRKDFPFFALAYTSAVEVARQAGNEKEADRILSLAVIRLSSDLPIHLDYARSAHRHDDWLSAVERWALIRERFPECEEARRREAEAISKAERQGVR